MREPKECTQVTPKSVRLSDTTYPIDWKNIPCVLSIQDIEWERINKVPCLVRKNLLRLSYKVEPPLEEKVVL